MEEFILNNETVISKIGSIFSLNNVAEFLFKNKIGILIVLDYVKAKAWPQKDKKLVNEPVEKIPLTWAFFHAPDKDSIKMVYDIHPAKCFPQLYNQHNPNSKKSVMPIRKDDDGDTLAGCSRNFVNISGVRYEIHDLTPKYCSIFGIPDDCYDSNFEKRMIDFLKQQGSLEIWCFEKTDYIQEKIEPAIKLNYMKGSFLPSKHFMYVDTSERFLRGVFKSKELNDINQELWYSSGKEFIEDLDLNDLESFRYEEQAIYYIKKRFMFEFARQSLLMLNKGAFSSYVPIGPPPLDSNKENAYQKSSRELLDKIEKEIESHLNTFIKCIETSIKPALFNPTRFLVMDVEYLPVTYPGKGQRSFNFPCMFVNIIWQGPKEGFKVDINILNLPCHACKKTDSCKPFKSCYLLFDCLPYCYTFLDKQINFIEELLTKYEGFKIYTYGKSDTFQIEQGNNFLSDSYELLRFKRRNRKREKRIVDISYDLSSPGIGLDNIESNILARWLIGWSRRRNKVNVTSRVMTKFDSKSWKNNYSEAINSCVSDTLSAFLYLVYRTYRLNDTPVKLKQFKLISDF